MPSFCFIWWSVRDSEPKRARLTQCFEAFFYARAAKYFAFCRVQMINCTKGITIGCAYAHPIVIPLVERTGFEPVTPTLPVLCAPNCANAPCSLSYHIHRRLSSRKERFFAFPFCFSFSYLKKAKTLPKIS